MMKRLYILLLIFVCACAMVRAGIHEYAEQSVLAEGTWVKLRVSQTGMYRLSYDEIKKQGLDPERVAIYGYGGAQLTQDFMRPHIDDLPRVPVYINIGADGVFGKGDYLLFYAQGPISWEYKNGRWQHTQNTYSTYGYYFMTDANGPYEGQVDELSSKASQVTLTEYEAYQTHDIDKYNLVDPSGKQGGGRVFYGDRFTGDTLRLTFSFTYANILQQSLRGYVDVAAKANVSSSFTLKQGDNSILLTISPVTDNYTRAKTRESAFEWMPQPGNQQSLTLSYQCSSSAGIGYLNYIDLVATCQLKMDRGWLAFRSSSAKDKVVTYRLEGASSQTQVWNVTNIGQIMRVPATLNGTILSWTQEGLQEYIAFDPDQVECLTLDAKTDFSKVPNQNLHALKDIDYVVLTNEKFLSQAWQIANLHAERDQMTVAVVTDKQVYNEFSSGSPDATAYRWVMKMLYDRADATIHAPGYLLLLGDGTYDNRMLRHGVGGTNTLLTYQSYNSVNETNAYATDDYFGFLDDHEGMSDVADRMDIAVGRWPVNTEEEAQTMVDKLIRYLDNDVYTNWRQQLVFLADDGDRNSHTKNADNVAEKVRVENPSFVVNKIYLDAYAQEQNASGERYPAAQTRLHNLLASGVLLFDYSGHGGYNNITSEQVLTLSHIRAMKNDNQAFWMLATCNFLSFDAGYISAGEEAVLTPDGGAIGVLAACRTVYGPQNETLNNNFCRSLFAHDDQCRYDTRVGDAAMKAKNLTGSDANKLPYILLCDPALKLHFPTDLQVKTLSGADTLHALSVDTLCGYLQDEMGDTARWFNGSLQVTIYDKMQQITTRDNDQSDPDEKMCVTYNDYPNVLFSGSTNVVDGHFSMAFMLPKDIQYSYGQGRIVYYAYDQQNDAEAIGHYEDFVVGGSSDVQIVDTVGPEIRMYINTPSFIEGMSSYEFPHFYAELYDEHGINTAGAGIGHDLLMTIDGDIQQTYVLNDFYKAYSGSYQSGLVSYRISSISAGEHTLMFRAWDLLNNSSLDSLRFVVVPGQPAQICEATLYPNPVETSGILTLRLTYDQPDEIMQTTVHVFDMSGRLCWQYMQRGTQNLQWSVSEMGLNKGLYLYQIQLQTGEQKPVKKTNKLIVF